MSRGGVSAHSPRAELRGGTEQRNATPAKHQCSLTSSVLHTAGASGENWRNAVGRTSLAGGGLPVRRPVRPVLDPSPITSPRLDQHARSAARSTGQTILSTGASQNCCLRTDAAWAECWRGLVRQGRRRAQPRPTAAHPRSWTQPSSSSAVKTDSRLC